MNDSIGKDFLDIITFELYSRAITSLKRKINTNPNLSKLRHKVGISDLDNSIQNVIELSMSKTKQKIIAIKRKHIKSFFSSERNNAVILGWVTTMPNLEDFDLGMFDMLPRDEIVPMEKFLKTLHSEIMNVKKTTFDANTLNILSSIENANKQVMDTLVEEVIPEIQKQPELIREIFREELKNANR